MLKNPKEKIKQISTIDIDQLVLLAGENNIHEDADVAKWIISVSPYWRSKGYDEIIKELQKNSLTINHKFDRLEIHH